MQDAANNHQTGGQHYLEMPIQPWNIFDTWSRERQIGFHLGNIVKYALRLGSKDDLLQEARKIQHYAQKLTEVLEVHEAQTEAAEDEQAWQDAQLQVWLTNVWRAVQPIASKKRKKGDKPKKPYTKELV